MKTKPAIDFWNLRPLMMRFGVGMIPTKRRLNMLHTWRQISMLDSNLDSLLVLWFGKQAFHCIQGKITFVKVIIIRTPFWELDKPFLTHFWNICCCKLLCTGKSLSEALLFAEHRENKLCTKIVLNVRNNFYTQHVLPRFELGIFMY